MGTVARRLNLRCFIDGIEVPIIGCRCTYAAGSPATAELQLVPSDEAYDIEPRALVTLFYYENYDYDRTTSGDTRLSQLGPSDLRRWKLLFVGEYITISYNKTSTGRAISMVCVDHTNYWDFIKQYQINMQNAGIELFENAFFGVRTGKVRFYDIAGTDTQSRIFNWLTKSKGPGGKANLYLGVQRTLREMWFSANDFYARAFNRLRVGDMIVGIPDDTSAATLFKLEFFNKFIKEQLGGGGGEVTLRSLLDNLLGTVFHTYVTVPAPKFDRKGECRGFSPSSKSPQDRALLSENIDRSKSWPEACLNYTIIKPDTWFCSPPACNIIFPHQYQALTFQRNYLQEPTRLFLRTSLLFSGADKWLTERFYSPGFNSVGEQAYKEGGYLRRLAQTSLPHEEFVGINPVQTWQPDISAYAQKGARREYLQRLSDYLFWKMRFGARGMDVSGPFNPNLVPGYPTLILNNVGATGDFPKHYLGTIQTISHSITQNEGGWTHISVVGAHTHTETVDFDGKGRSLEEITNRATDGFIDDRYDSSRIGTEVYPRLFGCNSIVETYLSLFSADSSDPVSQRNKTLAQQGVGVIPRAVEVIHGFYQRALKDGQNVDAFAQSITWRPKANLLEMLGTSFVEGLGPSPAQIDPDLLNFQYLQAQDIELTQNEGFLASCVDPDAKTTTDATFVATTRRQVAKTTVTKVPAVIDYVGGNGQGLVRQEAETITSTTYQDVETNKKGNYDLSGHLRARRVKVKAYADSLRLRGIRG